MLMCMRSAGDYTNPIVLSHCLWFTIVVDTPEVHFELGGSHKDIELVKLRDLEKGVTVNLNIWRVLTHPNFVSDSIGTIN